METQAIPCGYLKSHPKYINANANIKPYPAQLSILVNLDLELRRNFPLVYSLGIIDINFHIANLRTITFRISRRLLRTRRLLFLLFHLSRETQSYYQQRFEKTQCGMSACYFDFLWFSFGICVYLQDFNSELQPIGGVFAWWTSLSLQIQLLTKPQEQQLTIS